jgi:hypothetical protein
LVIADHVQAIAELNDPLEVDDDAAKVTQI